MGIFILPDLGEGLPDATIRKWYVKVGDTVKTDQPLVAVETAKAVVDIPAAFTGKLTALKGNPGDIINVGDAIIEYEEEKENIASAPEKQPSTHADEKKPSQTTSEEVKPSVTANLSETKPSTTTTEAKPSVTAPETKPSTTTAEIKSSKTASEAKPSPAPSEIKPSVTTPETTKDTSKASSAQTVVGNLKTAESSTITQESATGVQPQQPAHTNAIKAVPAARLIAKEFNIDLSTITPSGKDGVITIDDVKKSLHANKPSATTTTPSTSTPSADNKLTPLTQAQRGLAQVMAKSHKEITPATLIENADLHAWSKNEDITVRLIQAIVAGLKTEPMLNAFYYHDQAAYQLNDKINIGIAVDTEKGLYLPVIKDAANLSSEQLREHINQFKQKSTEQTFSADDLDGANIMLSNYGSIIGHYATPTLVPPMVTIVGAGKIYRKVVPADDQKVEIHQTLPLSVTIDHRLITGGQVARFLQTLIQTLEKANN
jgi:pyruvate dehydrogenase E2 component (dihydrolipoamide acetyltransferase)